MSLQGLSKQTIIRLPKIKSGLLQRWNRERIGESCHVTEKTIDRDIQAWVKTEDFIEWIRDLWVSLYQKVPEEVAFKEASRLFMKSMVVKAEIHKEITERKEVKVSFDGFNDAEREFAKSIARKYIKANNKRVLDSLH